MVAVRAPPALRSVSLTPVTVTVWGVSQLDGVKVSASPTVAAVVVSLAGVTVTSPAGRLLSTTVYAAVPFSRNLRLAVLTRTPGGEYVRALTCREWPGNPMSLPLVTSEETRTS